MDMQMPVMDGVQATQLIHQEHPEIAVLGLSTFTTDQYVVPLIRAGASGYLVKDATPQEMVAAVRAVHSGDSALSQAVTRHVLRGVETSIEEPTPDPEALELLTDKELEVLHLLAEGTSNRRWPAGSSSASPQ